jgi:hypothetical protein
MKIQANIQVRNPAAVVERFSRLHSTKGLS